MKLAFLFKASLRELKVNKLRSFLTILGIIIGIWAVVTVMSLGIGVQNSILNQIASLGSNNIFIEPGPWSEKIERRSIVESMIEKTEIKTLTFEDAEAIRKLPEIEAVAPFVIGIERIVYKDKSKKITFLGTTPDALKIADTEIILGDNLTKEDVKLLAKKIVLGYKVRKDLFGEEDPIGKIVRIKKNNFRVVGVVEERGMQAFMNLDEQIYLPITTAQKNLLGENHVRWIIAKTKSEDLIDGAVEEIRLLLRERHRIKNPTGDPSKDDFKVISQKETAKILGNITGIFTLFLTSLATISLIVGGIGIMNIMLVSVKERTREIGLRKAIGATKKDILIQFLLESAFLTLIGGIIGIILGVSSSYLGGVIFKKSLLIKWKFFISFKAIILGFLIAILIGLIFGLYPAKKAADLSPIEALRYE